MALIPLALAGVLPLWACLPICGVFALGVRKAQWAQGRLLISLLIVGLLMTRGISAALSAPKDQLLLLWRDLGPLYVQQVLSVWALHWSAAQLEEGRPRGFVGVLLVGLLAPHPALILALGGAALARYAPDDRLRSRNVSSDPRLWWLVGSLVAGVLALSLLLPRGHLASAEHRLEVSPSPPLAAGSNKPGRPPPASSSRPGQASGGVARSSGVLLDRVAPFPIELFGLVTVLVLVAMLLRLGSRRAQGRPPTLAEWMMVAALVVNLAILVILGTPLGGSGAGAPLPPEAVATGRGGAGAGQGTLSPGLILMVKYLNLLLWVSFVFYLVMGAVLLWYWWQDAQDETGQNVPALPEGMEDDAPEAPLHRVRQAYRRAEALLTDSGRGRAASETPAGYALRVAEQDVALTGPLGVLTRAYQPVRYGGRVTDEDAEAAEQAVREVQTILPTLPARTDDAQNGKEQA